MLRREMGSRGITSIESSVINGLPWPTQTSKGTGLRTYRKNGEDVEDRYASDVTFCDRVHEEGSRCQWGLSDCILYGWHVRLCKSSRWPTQTSPLPELCPDLRGLSDCWRRRQCQSPISAGVAANKTKIACPSWFTCPNLAVWKDSPLNFASHGRRFGVSCLAATFLPKMNMSATSAEGAHIVACWPGRAPSKFLLMALLHSSKSCMRKIFHWFGATLNAKKSRVPQQRPEVQEVKRPTPRSRPQPSESAKQKLTPVPLDKMTQPPQAPRERTPHPVQGQHHFWRQSHRRPKEEQDHSWSLRHHPLPKQRALSHQRLQAPVARMPPGAGTAITTVHVASGVFGADHGTTEMRPAAVGSIGTAGRYDLL